MMKKVSLSLMNVARMALFVVGLSSLVLSSGTSYASPSQTEENQELSLRINPGASNDKWQEFNFTVRVPDKSEGLGLCTGWTYPIVQLHEDEWPRGESCRILTDQRYVQTSWGGARYPLPYSGEYRGYAYLYNHNTHEGTLKWVPFRLLYE